MEALSGKFAKVRFTTSGSRMVDEAILLSRFIRVSAERTAARTAIIANFGSWHGTGGISLAATGYAQAHDIAGPISTDFHHVPVNDLAALEMKIAELGPDRVSALLLEPVLGVAGVLLEPGYMEGVQRIARTHGLHLILDEITTGVGRLGALSYGRRMGIEPDMLILGKGLTSGYVPVSALAVTQEIYREALSAWPRVFPHASTNDGNPAAMAAGLAVLEALESGEIYRHVDALGRYVSERLWDIAKTVSPAAKVVGSGLIQFLYLDDERGVRWPTERTLELIKRCEQLGLLVDCVFGRIVFTPPLITSHDEIDQMLTILVAAIGAS